MNCSKIWSEFKNEAYPQDGIIKHQCERMLAHSASNDTDQQPCKCRCGAETRK